MQVWCPQQQISKIASPDQAAALIIFLITRQLHHSLARECLPMQTLRLCSEVFQFDSILRCVSFLLIRGQFDEQLFVETLTGYK
jgi:hypothetical protein